MWANLYLVVCILTRITLQWFEQRRRMLYTFAWEPLKSNYLWSTNGAEKHLRDLHPLHRASLIFDFLRLVHTVRFFCLQLRCRKWIVWMSMRVFIWCDFMYVRWIGVGCCTWLGSTPILCDCDVQFQCKYIANHMQIHRTLWTKSLNRKQHSISWYNKSQSHIAQCERAFTVYICLCMLLSFDNKKPNGEYHTWIHRTLLLIHG